MRRWLAAPLLAAILLAAACGPGAGGTSTGLALGGAPWEDGDRATYDWIDKSGNKIGTEEIVFARAGQSWLLTETDKIGDLNQVAKVRIDANTPKPLSEDKTIDSTGTSVTVTTTYAGGKLDIKAVVNGENKSATSVVLLQTGTIDAIGTEVWVVVVSVGTIGAALWLRWRGGRRSG